MEAALGSALAADSARWPPYAELVGPSFDAGLWHGVIGRPVGRLV